jgi:hypothetical protein
MDAVNTYFLANRAWWFTALLVGPIVGAIAEELVVVIIVTAVLALPALIVLDTDRPWWPDEVRRIPEVPDRSRLEVRKLTLWSGIGLAVGLAIALIRPWSQT